MNTVITHTPQIFIRIARSLCILLMLAFIMPASAFSQNSPAPVKLGTAGDFAILAKTKISSTGTTQITGDVGISPAAATFITGFGLIADPTNTFSTSSFLTGKAYAANYAVPTPTKMLTAINDMQTAYTDAAGRTLPDHTELYTGILTGKTLTPGLYNWSTAVLIGAAGVTITGSATDVWIFQIAQDLELSSGAIVTLSGGAQASNIYWQVAGQVTLGTSAAMKGIILCKSQIVMSTGSKLNGRALAQTAVTLDATTVNQPMTANPPAVLSTDPVNLATGVAINQHIAVFFNRAMDAATISNTTFTLKQGTTSVSGFVSYSGTTAHFSTASNLSANSTYTATITTGAADLAGNTLASNYVWSFTTGSAIDATPPTVSSTNPVNNATGVVLNHNVVAVFSKTIDAASISTTTFTLKQGASVIAGTVTYTGLTATYTPLANLLPNMVYTATVTTGVSDLEGHALANNYIWNFSTGTALAVEQNSPMLRVFSLEQNYPNPFNPTTRIQYSIEKPAVVSLIVYNLVGNEVITLVNGIQTAGSHTVEFNATNANLNLSSGVYFYRLESGSFVSTKKLIFMK